MDDRPVVTPIRYHYVDLLRGAAALAVVMMHYQGFFAPGFDRWPAPEILRPPGVDWLLPFYTHAGIAVHFFWLLSGFVFAIAYGRFGRGLSLREFVVHRFARLYPLHVATLLIVAALQAIGLALNGFWQVYGPNDLPHFLLHLALASNWFTETSTFNGPIWSVSVEIVIYLAFVVFMKVCGLRLLPALALFIGFFVLSWRTQNLIALCGALFFAGVVLGILIPRAQQRLRIWALGLGLAACPGALAMLWLLRSLGYFNQENLVILYLWFVVMPALIFTFAMFDGNLRPLSPRLRWIGAITYAVYLVHMPVVIAARTFAPEIFTDRNLLLQWPMFAAYVATVVLLAVPVHYWFERPTQRFLRRRLGRKSPARPENDEA